MSARGMDSLRKTTLNIYGQNKIGRNFNVSMDEFIKLRQQFVNGIGRNVGAGSKGLSDLAAMSRIFGEQGATEFASKLENFGLSLAESGDRAGKLWSRATKFGISAEKMSKNFLTNISKAQDYTFAKGLKGLENMAKRATELKLDMGQALSFADKVSTVEGAITTAANLQVLGGPFTQYSDAIQMLQEGLTDPEALQERMVKMFGNMGHFNRQTGEVEVSAFNRQRIKAAAQAAGLDYSNIMEMVFSNARGTEIARQAGNNGIFANNQGFMNLIKNVGTIEKGVAGAYLTRNGQQEFVKAQDFTKQDIVDLVTQSKSESENIQDITKMLRGWDDIISGGQKQREAARAQVVETKGIGQRMQRIVDVVSSNNFLLKTIAIGSIYGGLMGAFGGAGLMMRGGARMVPGVKNLFTRTASGRIGGGRAFGFGGAKGGAAVRANGGNFVKLSDGTVVGAKSGRSISELRRMAVGSKAGGSVAGRAIGGIGGRVATGLGGSLTGGLLSGVFTAFDEFGTENNHSTVRKVGTTLGTTAGGIIGGLIGSAIAPGIGTAVGSMIGAELGRLAGGNDNRRNKKRSE